MLDEIHGALNISADPETKALQEATRPDAMVEQIKNVIEQNRA